MARNFSTNQNRHIFVAKTYGDVKADSATGTITVKSFTNGLDKEFYLLYKGADTVLKSPTIQVKNLNYAKATKKEDLVIPFKSQVVALDKNVNGGAPVSGQDYIMRIVLRQWIGMSDKDQYIKDVVVHATSGMTAADFYKALVTQLNLCFSKEVGASTDANPYLKFETVTSAVSVYNPETKATESVSEGIKITEKAQGWTLGLEQQLPVLFDAVPTTVYIKDDNADVIWGKVYDATAKKADVVVGETGRGNGHDIADLEYFAMGERGDQYRMIGWPNIVPTRYLVDPDEQYNVLDLHFAFTDEGVTSYRSEKEVTIVATDSAVIDDIVAAINKAAGTSIATLAASTASGN